MKSLILALVLFNAPLIWLGLNRMSDGADYGQVLAQPQRTLDAQRLARFLRIPVENWGQAQIDQQVSHFFGLTRGQETISLRQWGKRDAASRAHVFTRLPGDSGFLLGAAFADGFHIYRVGADLKLESAALKNRGEPPVQLPFAQARRELESELQFWADFVDSIPSQ